jgi:hypothetical protein
MAFRPSDPRREPCFSIVTAPSIIPEIECSLGEQRMKPGSGAPPARRAGAERGEGAPATLAVAQARPELSRRGRDGDGGSGEAKPAGSRKDEDLVGRGQVCRGDAIVLTHVIYKITVVRGGAVFGEIKAPYDECLRQYVGSGPADWLRLRLDDGRLVFFQLRRADTIPGGWGELEGRLSP